MEDIAAVSNEHEEAQGPSEEQEIRCDDPSKPLEIQIANRAQEISLRGDGHSGLSLASWLKAAREILSENTERSHSII